MVIDPTTLHGLCVLPTPDRQTWGADVIAAGGYSVRVIHWPTGLFVVESGDDFHACYRDAVDQLRRNVADREAVGR